MCKKNIVLYSHSGSENHGCEAIVRSTEKLIHNDYNIYLMSSNVKADNRYGIGLICDGIFSTKEYKKRSLEYIKYAFKYRIKKKEPSPYGAACWQIKNYVKNGIAMSIGGDNYCYLTEDMTWLINELIESHKYFLRRKMKTVLWGCSVEEECLKDRNILKDLKKFNLITVRENMSKENLYKYGIKDNVVMTCDSAFFLNTVRKPLPENFISGNTVGINISPMVIEHEKKEGIVFQNYIQLINYILKETEMNIALIPHVIWEGNDDRNIINAIFERYANQSRIVKVEDSNCEILKGYISQCRFFIGARTHATIAAYSTGVPTLVSGYSIKSKGIAKDLFGTYENYVVPVSEMKHEDDLLRAFLWLESNENKIKEILKKVLPEYKQKMYGAIEALNRL